MRQPPDGVDTTCDTGQASREERRSLPWSPVRGSNRGGGGAGRAEANPAPQRRRDLGELLRWDPDVATPAGSAPRLKAASVRTAAKRAFRTGRLPLSHIANSDLRRLKDTPGAYYPPGDSWA